MGHFSRMDIGTMGILRLLFSFQGRVKRGPFWITFAVLTMLMMISAAFLNFLSTQGAEWNVACVIGTIVGLFFTLGVARGIDQAVS